MVEEIRLVVTAPPMQGGGLKQTLGYLRAIEGAMGRMGKLMAGVGSGPDLEMIHRRVKGLGGAIKDLSVLNVGRAFENLDPRIIERGIAAYADQLKRSGQKLSQAIKGYSPAALTGTFTNNRHAENALAMMYRIKAREEARAFRHFTDILGGGGGGAAARAPSAAGAASAATVSSPIVLKIRGDQVVAELVTPPPVVLRVPGSAIAGGGGSGGGQAGGGGGGGSKAGGGKAGAPTPIQTIGGITRMVSRTTPAGDVYNTITEALAPFRVRRTQQTRRGNVVDEIQLRAEQVRDRLNAVLGEESQRLGELRERLKAVKDRAQRARQLSQQAGLSAQRIESELTGRLGADLQSTQQGELLRRAMFRASMLRAVEGGQSQLGQVESNAQAQRAQRATQKADARQMKRAAEAALRQEAQAMIDEAQRIKPLRNPSRRARLMSEAAGRSASNLELLLSSGLESSLLGSGQSDLLHRMRQRVSGLRAVEEARAHAAQVEKAARDMRASELLRRRAEARLNAGGYNDPKPGPFSGHQWMRNAAKVAMWSTAAVPVYGAVSGLMSLGASAVTRPIERSYQTARLAQVFRGEGGTARDLTRDVLGLAAAEGQAADSAMESAISWSRLGLSRKQVAEAVRVSLQAANVAELDSLEATKKLQSVMMAYGMGVEHLAGLLGKLNSVSNTLNVTNAELFAGMEKSAGVARQMGMPVEMLIGMIGAGASRGQTGSQMGNALKTFMVRLMDPGRQTRLATELGIETRTSTGLKPAEAIFGEMAERWQTMNGQQRGLLQNIVAGATQGNRLAITLEAFTTASVQAINAGLNLQSAEREDARIKAEAKNRIEGLVSAWDKLTYEMDSVTGFTRLLSSHLSQLAEGMGLVGDAVGAVDKIIGAAFGVREGSRGEQFIRLLNPAGSVSARTEMSGRSLSALRRWLGGELTMKQANAEVFSPDSATQIQAIQAQAERTAAFQRAAALFQLKAMGSTPTGARLEEAIRELSDLPPSVIGGRDEFVKGLRQAAQGGTWQQFLGGRSQGLRSETASSRARLQELIDARTAEIDRDAAQMGPGKRRTQLEEERRRLLGMNREADQPDPELQAAVVAEALRTNEMLLDRIERKYRDLNVAASQRRFVEEAMAREQYVALAVAEAHETVELKRAELAKRRLDVQERLAALVSPEVRGAEALNLSRSLAQEVAATRLEEETPDAGDDIGRLRNREATAQRLLAGAQAQVAAARDEYQQQQAIAEALAYQRELEETRLNLVRERAKAAREEREYQRSALTAGSDELVRRAMASRMGTPQAAEFFTWSPEMRRTFLDESTASKRRSFLAQPVDTAQLHRNIYGDESFRAAAVAAASASVGLGNVGRAAGDASVAFQQLVREVSGFLERIRPSGGSAGTGVAGVPPNVSQADNGYGLTVRW